MANNRIDYSLTDYYNTNNGGLAGYYSNGNASGSNSSMYQQQHNPTTTTNNDQQMTQDSLLFQMFEDEMNMFNNYGFMHNHQDLTAYLNDYDRKIDSELNLFLGNLDWMSPLPTPPLSPLQTMQPTMQPTMQQTMPTMQTIPAMPATTMQTIPAMPTTTMPAQMQTMPPVSAMPPMTTMPSMQQTTLPSIVPTLPSVIQTLPSMSSLPPSTPTCPPIMIHQKQTSITTTTNTISSSTTTTIAVANVNQRPYAKATANNANTKTNVKKNSTIEPAKKQKQPKAQTKRTSCGTSLLATRPKLVKKQCKESLATNHKLSNKSNTPSMKSIQLPTVIIASNSSAATKVSFTNPALREHDYCKMLY